MSDLTSIQFSIETAIGTYTDCLFVSSDLSEEDIEVLKQSRVDAWVEYVTTSCEDPGEIEMLSMQSITSGCGCDQCVAMRKNQ